MIPWLFHDTPFPEVSSALTVAEGAPGLLAAGADLLPARLLDAYSKGIFPWFSEDQPILWWSPDPRMVLYTKDLKVSHSLRKTLRKVERSRQTDGVWKICFDTDFEAVIRCCAAPRESLLNRGNNNDNTRTWISEKIIASYTQLHTLGFAHCIETWRNGELIGGVYGISMGRMFFGESMFSRVTDASKIALVYLVNFLRDQGVQLIDCQQETSHLASLGATTMLRSAFVEHVRQAIHCPQIAIWAL